MKLLGDVAKVIDCEHRTAPMTDGEPFAYSIGTRAVRSGKISLDAAKPVSGETYRSWVRRAEPQPGDLILSREAPMGEVGIVPHNARMCLGQRTVLLKVNSELVDQQYLLYLLMSPPSQEWIQSNSAGSTVLHLNVADVRRIPLTMLPSLDDQRRIVDILEDHLSRLDAAESALPLALRKADAMVASSLNAHTTRGHDCWRNTTVGEGASRVEYGSSAKCGVQINDDDVPVLRMGNIRNGAVLWDALKYLPVDHDEFPKLLLHPGDLLFNRTNSADLVGKSAVFTGGRVASFASYLIRVRFHEDVFPAWVNMVINSPMGRRYVSSVVSQQVGQANVNGTKLKAFPLPIPPLDEQARRVRAHEEVVASREQLRVEVENARTRAANLRRSLLSAAFSGRLNSTSINLPEALESE